MKTFSTQAKYVLYLLTFQLTLVNSLCGQPWEPEDIKPIYEFNAEMEFKISPFAILADNLITYYQKKISPNSISRCPFYISCSNFADQAIDKFGLPMGILLFIDRNFYRENIAAFKHYELREDGSGRLRLDDSFYIYGKDFAIPIKLNKPHLQH